MCGLPSMSRPAAPTRTPRSIAPRAARLRWKSSRPALRNQPVGTAWTLRASLAPAPSRAVILVTRLLRMSAEVFGSSGHGLWERCGPGGRTRESASPRRSSRDSPRRRRGRLWCSSRRARQPRAAPSVSGARCHPVRSGSCCGDGRSPSPRRIVAPAGALETIAGSLPDWPGRTRIVCAAAGASGRQLRGLGSERA